VKVRKKKLTNVVTEIKNLTETQKATEVAFCVIPFAGKLSGSVY
jgi:hypothetical protein